MNAFRRALSSTTRLVTAALVTVALMAWTAALSNAAVVSPVTSTVPAHINMMGFDAEQGPDPRGRFEVVCRDESGAPVPNVEVRVIVPMSTGLRLECYVNDPPGTVYYGAEPAIARYTDANGRVQFMMAGAPVPNTAGVISPRAIIRVGGPLGVILGTPTVGCPDLSDADGISIPDLGLWMVDFLSPAPPGRADFDGDGAVTIADLSLWAEFFFARGSSTTGIACF